MGVTHVGVCQGSSKDTGGGGGGLHMLEYAREAVRILGGGGVHMLEYAREAVRILGLGGGYTCWSMPGKQ